jgi:hypothetical protein
MTKDIFDLVQKIIKLNMIIPLKPLSSMNLQLPTNLAINALTKSKVGTIHKVMLLFSTVHDFMTFIRTYLYLLPGRIDIPVFRNHGKLTIILESLTNLHSILDTYKNIAFWSAVKTIAAGMTLVNSITNKKANNKNCFQKKSIIKTNYFADSDITKANTNIDSLSQKLRWNIDSLIQSMKLFFPEICSDKFTLRCYSLTSDTFKMPFSNEAFL